MSDAVQSPPVDPLHSFRVRIILSWALLLMAVFFFVVAEEFLLGLICNLVILAVRNLLQPRFPPPPQSTRVQILCLLGVLALVISHYIVPLPARPVIGGGVAAVLLIAFGYSDYRLFMSRGYREFGKGENAL